MHESLVEDAAATICLEIPPESHADHQMIQQKLVDVFGKHSVDIVHSHHLFTDLYAIPAARQLGIGAVIRHVHGILQVSVADGFNKPRARLSWEPWEIAEEVRLDGHVALTVCVSHELKRKLESYGLPAAKLHVIHNGVDCERYQPVDPLVWRIPTRRSLSIDEADPLVGFVGRFEPCKNPAFVATLARDLLAIRPDAWFVVVADGPQELRFRATLRDYGIDSRFRILPPIGDVRPVLSAIDVLLVPSITEGCPNVVLEGMAMGTVVVASGVGGIPEIVTSDHDGVLIDIADIETAVAILVDLLRNPQRRERLGFHGRNTVRKRFPMTKMLDAIGDVYDKVLA